MPIPQAAILIDYPQKNNQYILFHLTGNYSNAQFPTELYYSLIDVSNDSVTLKNQIIINDKIGYVLSACKHANGRDWWITAFKDSSDYVYSIEVTAQGISTPVLQKLNTPNHNAFINQPTFSRDGKQFAFHYYYGTIPNNIYDEVRLFDFDRCTGQFSNYRSITIGPSNGGLGLAFSPNSKQLYFCTFDTVYQLQTDSTNLLTSLQVVAINDGFYSPIPPYQTNFWDMYLGANGKIYISSGSSVISMHYIDSPDVFGIGCNVQLHSLPLPCWTIRANVNHPNYYLGCDTTLGCGCATSYNDVAIDNYTLRIFPNPSNGNFNIGYKSISKSSLLSVINTNGVVVFSKYLPRGAMSKV
ncbi:MAG: hypothetical protein IPP29_25160 [Bacteroidetes bacterium]|nr:hypothetical protein [Bacteroidota bacterium]